MNRENIICLIESEIKNNKEPEVNLMRGVVKQGFLDLLIISKNPKYQKWKSEAKIWFTEESEDLKFVCNLAQLNYQRIRMIYDLINTLEVSDYLL